jgi:CheY-like chemotaxis protein
MNQLTKFILIDDNEIDNKVNLNLLKIMDVGDDCVGFLSCCSALDYIKENLNLYKNHKCIILLDIQMPEVDGFECLEKYGDLPKSFIDNTQVYFLSSTIDEHDIKRAKENPLAVTILEKPLDVFILKKHLGLE